MKCRCMGNEGEREDEEDKMLLDVDELNEEKKKILMVCLREES